VGEKRMNILVTGAKGFIGKNLISTLQNIRDEKDKSFKLEKSITIFEYDLGMDEMLLESYCKNADFIFHLAGVNRPKKAEEYLKGNCEFTAKILEILKKYQRKCPVLLSSSIQAELNNPYGKSKKESENLLFSYAKETGANVYIYRLPNVFGKWCKPNYNSVVATFCNNIANDIPIQINNPNTVITLAYVDDVVEEFILALKEKIWADEQGFCHISTEYKVKLGEIASLLYSFKESRKNKIIPDMTEGSFSKKLYATYLSYLPIDGFCYSLNMNKDERGSFTEIVKSFDRGQISVNVIKPGITKGEHWHHTKNEKFVVVSGKGLIRFRKVGSDEIINYYVSGDKIQVVDIPTGYTHNITNMGNTDLITIIWCNECFNPEKPDTYFLKVEE